MLHRADLSGTIRHTHKRCMCLLPVWDRTGLWPVKTWLFWTWDFTPPSTGERIGELMAELRRQTADDFQRSQSGRWL